jgi:Tfp pilus assembly protein PilF
MNLGSAQRICVSFVLLSASFIFATETQSSPQKNANENLQQAMALWAKSNSLIIHAAYEALNEAVDVWDQIRQRDSRQAIDDEAEKFFRLAIEAAPQNFEMTGSFGMFLFSRRRFVEALFFLEQAVTADSFETHSVPAKKAVLLRTIGATWERKGFYRQALAAYRRAWAIDSSDARNLISLGGALTAAGRVEDADEILTAHLDVFADVAVAAKRDCGLENRAYGLLLIAGLKEIGQKWEAAEDLYEKAAAAARELKESELCLEAEQGRKRVQNLLRRDNLETLDRRRKAQALFERACTYERLSRNEAADTLLRDLHAEENEEKRRQILKHEALAPLLTACESLLEATTMAPRWGRAHAELGKMNLRLGRVEEAVGHLEAAALYDPFSSSAGILLAGTLLHSGEWEQALTVYSDLAAREPEFGPAHWGAAKAAVLLRRSEKECAFALAAAERAERCGVDLALVLPLRQKAAEIRERLRRGETVSSEPRKRLRRWVETQNAPQARQTFNPWEGTVLDY